MQETNGQNQFESQPAKSNLKNKEWWLAPCRLFGKSSTYDAVKPPTKLPAISRELAWLISIGGSIWISYYVMLLSFEWGSITSWSWLTSLTVSILTMMILTDPLIVLVIAFISAMVWGGIEVDNDEPHLAQNAKLTREVVKGNSATIERLRKHRKKEAVRVDRTASPSQLAARQARLDRDTIMAAIIKKLLGFFLLYAMLLSILYAQRFDGAFTLTGAVLTAASARVTTTKHASKMFSGASTKLDTTPGQFGSINNREDFWDWCENSVGTMRQNSESVYTGNTDQLKIGEIYLLGAIRLRQLRVRPNTCALSRSVSSLMDIGCNPRWSIVDESRSNFAGHRTVPAELSDELPARWSYGTSMRLRASVGSFGSGEAEGKISLKEMADGSFALSFALHKVQARSVGKIFVSTSLDCTSNILEPFSTNNSWSGGTSPWLSSAYLSDRNGDATDSFRVYFGHGYEQTKGHAVAVLDTAGKAIGCGVLESSKHGATETTSSRGNYHNTLYSGIGFSETLPLDTSKTRKVISDLRAQRWLDELTRSVVVEYTVYSPSTDYVATVQLLVETPPTGDALTKVLVNTIKIQRYDGPDAWVLVLFEFMVLASTIYLCRSVFKAAKEHKRIQREAEQAVSNITNEVFTEPTTVARELGEVQIAQATKRAKTSFFSIFENCNDALLVLFCFATLGGFWIRQFMVNAVTQKWKSLLKEDRTEYFDGFFHVSKADNSSIFISGATMIFATLKLILLFKHNLKVKRLLWLFKIVAVTASAVVVQMAVILTAYAFAGTLLLGFKSSSFSTIGNSYATLFVAILGKFEAGLFMESGLVSKIYFMTFQALTGFVVLNFFIAVLTDAVLVITSEMAKDDANIQYDLWSYIWSRALYFFGISFLSKQPNCIEKTITHTTIALTNLDSQLDGVLKRATLFSNNMGVDNSIATEVFPDMPATTLRAISSVRKLFCKYEDADAQAELDSRCVESPETLTDEHQMTLNYTVEASRKAAVKQATKKAMKWMAKAKAAPKVGTLGKSRAEEERRNKFDYKAVDFGDLVERLARYKQSVVIIMGKRLADAIENKRDLFGKVLGDVDDVFLAMDQDGNGSVSPEELFAGFTRLGLQITEVSSQEVFDAIDTAGIGSINIDNLKKFLVMAKAVSYETIGTTRSTNDSTFNRSNSFLSRQESQLFRGMTQYRTKVASLKSRREHITNSILADRKAKRIASAVSLKFECRTSSRARNFAAGDVVSSKFDHNMKHFTANILDLTRIRQTPLEEREAEAIGPEHARNRNAVSQRQRNEPLPMPTKSAKPGSVARAKYRKLSVDHTMPVTPLGPQSRSNLE
jgi:hypothetical protein